MSRFWTTAALALVLMGCSDGENGSFSLSFAWDEPPAETVWVWVQVEERTDAAKPGRILASAGPDAFIPQTKTSFALEGVPNGTHRYVVAEVREGANPALPVLYYGISEPFSLAFGKHTKVEVAMALRPPEVETQGGIRLLFSGDELATVSEDQLSRATVALEAARARGVIFANNAAFTASQKEYVFGEEGELDCTVTVTDEVEWRHCTLPVWDLTAGLETPPADLRYTLFAKFIDRYGYESEVFRASVLLDKEGPQVLLASVTPAVVKPGDTAYVNVTFHEIVDPSQTTLTTDPAPAGLIVSGPTRVGASTAYVWQLTPSAPYAGPVSYGLHVLAFDPLGNQSPAVLMEGPELPAAVVIDGTAPLLLTEHTVPPQAETFGVEDVGTVLEASFVIEEDWPLSMILDASGICTSGCPVVHLGTRQLGQVSRDTELDSGNGSQLGFRWTYTLAKDDFLDSDVALLAEVSWTDRAGNGLAESLLGPLHFDFIRPGILNCSLSPTHGNEGSVFIYQITATEPLATEPELILESDVGKLFAMPPKVLDNGQTYQWSQSAAKLESGSFSVATRLWDSAGNGAIENDSGGVCPSAGTVDGLKPVLQGMPSLTTYPEVLDLTGEPALIVGDGMKLIVSFTVEESSGLAPGFPDVQLAIPSHEVKLTPFSVDESSPGVWNYSYMTTIWAKDNEGGEGLWPVRVALRDKAGNEDLIPALGERLVKVDFTPPMAVCELVPQAGLGAIAIDQKVLVQLTPLEPLAPGSLPVLEEAFDPPLAAPFFTYEAGTQYRFEGTVSETGSDHSFTVGISLLDLVGNTTPPGGTSCTGGLLTGLLDGSRPTLGQVQLTVDNGDVDPAVTPLKKGRKISLVLEVSGTDSPPAASLGMHPFTLSPAPPVATDEGWLWTLTRVLDGNEGEGTKTVEVSVSDPAGNTLKKPLATLPVTLDFTPPGAQCSFFPESAAVGDTVVLTANVSEPLANNLPELSCDLPFAKLDPADKQVTFTYSYPVSTNDAALDGWSYQFSFCDVAGNCGPGSAECSGGGIVDAQLPLVKNGAVTTNPAVFDGGLKQVLAVKDQGEILATFDIVESNGLAPEMPQVFLQAGNQLLPFEKVSLNPGPEQTTFASYRFQADALLHGSLEGLWPVRVVVADQAGNVVVEDLLGGPSQRVSLDFSSPQAVCSLLPPSGMAGYAIGATVVAQVSAVELLSATVPPEIIQEFTPAAPGDIFALLDDTSYQFSGTIGDWGSEGTFSLAVALTDLVGNATPAGSDACQGTLTASYDALRPMVGDLVLTADGQEVQDHQPLGADRTVQATFTVDNSPLKPTVLLGGMPMSPAAELPTTEGVGLYGWTFSRKLLPSDVEGLLPIAISGKDEAGNTYAFLQDPAHALLDFSAPLAGCFINVSPAKAGETQRLTVSLSEPLLALPTVTSPVDWQYREDLSDPGDETPTYVFEHPVALGDPPTQWSAAILGKDLAGNPLSGAALCQVEGAFDGDPITLSTTSVSVTYPDPATPGSWLDGVGHARLGSRVTVQFTTSELPAPDSTEVLIGGQKATLEDLTDQTHTYALQISEQHGFAHGEQLPVTVEVADSAGNVSFQTVGNIALDLLAPALFGSAYLERCDGFAKAKASSNKLWVRKETVAHPYGCSYDFSPADCGAQGAPGSGRVRISFALAEPIQLHRLSLTVGGETLLVDPCASTSTFVSALYEPKGTESQAGWLPVVVGLEDLAGNSATVTAGELHFDFAAPPAPSVAADNTIIYQRIPWGSQSTNGKSRYEVWGDAGAVEENSTLRVLDSETVDGAYQLGSGIADGTGAFGTPSQDKQPLFLDAADRAHVYLVALDAAGNMSDADDNPDNGLQAALVRNSRWVATYGGKDAGSTLVNPNRFATTTWMRQSLSHPDDVEVGEATGIAAAGGPLLTTRGASLSWRKMVPNQGEPGPRTHHAMAFDRRRGVAVLFGGLESVDSITPYDDLWEWDGDLWHLITPSDPEQDGNPSGRIVHSMAYSTQTDRVLLFGGTTLLGTGGAFVFQNDLWSWDGVSWELLEPSDPEGDGNPPPRIGAGMAYDSARGQLVLFGGLDANEDKLSDTWLWNGISWHKVTPIDPQNDGNPKADAYHQMSYDSDRALVVMKATFATTWEWDGKSWRKGPGGPKASESQMAYDPGLKRTVLYECSSAADAQFTWFWNGQTWQKQTTQFPAETESADEICGGAMVFDANRKRLMLFAGSNHQKDIFDAKSSTSNTYWWRGDFWEVGRTPLRIEDFPEEGMPICIHSHTMAYFPGADKVVVAGGYEIKNLDLITWFWEQSQWRWWDDQAIPLGTQAAVSYDAKTESLMYYGGKDAGNGDRLWRFTKLWNELGVMDFFTNDGNPSGRHGTGLAFDPGHGKSGAHLLYGGYHAGALSDTWLLRKESLWFGWEWDQLNPTQTPGKRVDHVLVHDASRDRTVLFGGTATGQTSPPVEGTWEWNGNTWQQAGISDPEEDGSPLARAQASAVYAPSRQRVIVAGGWEVKELNQYLSQGAWEYGGANPSWHFLTEADPQRDGSPPPRYLAGMAFDESREELLVMGGRDFTKGCFSDTWKGRFSYDTMPGHLASFPVDSAGYCGTPEFTRVAVEWTAGGDSPATNPAIPGAALRVWDQGQWRPIDDHASTSPAALAWSTDNPDEIRRLLLGDYRTLHFNAISQGPNLLGHATVSTDYVEVTVDFRLPPEDEELCE